MLKNTICKRLAAEARIPCAPGRIPALEDEAVCTLMFSTRQHSCVCTASSHIGYGGHPRHQHGVQPSNFTERETEIQKREESRPSLRGLSCSASVSLPEAGARNMGMMAPFSSWELGDIDGQGTISLQGDKGRESCGVHTLVWG